MTETDIPDLYEREQCEAVLTAILRVGRPRPGLTLIAHIHLKDLEALGVRRVATPEPPPDDAIVNDPLACSMSPILREIATEMVPERTRTRRGWRAPDRELITVVCRNGAPVITHTEEQFFWGWRYSNHCTMAFHGDVYVVTPAGWAGLLGGAGSTPTLGVEADSSGCEDDVRRFPPLRHELLYPAELYGDERGPDFQSPPC